MKTQKFDFGWFTVLLGLLFAGTNILAQEPAAKNIYGGAGYFMTGYSRVDFQELNTRLMDLGYPEVAGGSLFLGGGGHVIFRNVIIGGEGGGAAASTRENADYRISTSGGYGFLNLGYVLLKSRKWLLYPLAGAGFGGMSLDITDKNNLPADFDELLSDPGRQSRIMHGGFMMHFSIGTDRFFGRQENGKETGGWLLGLKAGYLLDLSGGHWSFDDRSLAGAPEAGMSGWYVRLTIGGGGFAKK